VLSSYGQLHSRVEVSQVGAFKLLWDNCIQPVQPHRGDSDGDAGDALGGEVVGERGVGGPVGDRGVGLALFFTTLFFTTLYTQSKHGSIDESQYDGPCRQSDTRE
jgi:hypothetical protein